MARKPQLQTPQLQSSGAVSGSLSAPEPDSEMNYHADRMIEHAIKSHPKIRRMRKQLVRTAKSAVRSFKPGKTLF